MITLHLDDACMTCDRCDYEYDYEHEYEHKHGERVET
jgi:hypothetical protein